MLAHRAPQSFDGLEVDALDVVNEADPSFNAILDQDRPGEELLWHLSALGRQVLGLRFGFTDGQVHSYVETARRLQMTVSKVRRTEQRALETLRGVCPTNAYLHL